MNIDLSSFATAIASLQRAIQRSVGNPADEELRDAVIHRFEFTWELAWKSMRRVLVEEAASPSEMDGLSFRDLIRRGAVAGMLDDMQLWFAFREARTISSHTYDETKAQEVYKLAIRFPKVAVILLHRLEARR